MSEFERAIVLHARAYGETSVILDLFTEQFGRFNAVLRGARSAKSTKRAYTQAFTPLLIQFHGRGELQTVTHIEADGACVELQGTALYTGLYINELLTRILPKFDCVPELYQHYHWLLKQLSDREDLEKNLRRFELHLLREIGFAVDFSVNGEELQPEVYYHYHAGTGFVVANTERISQEILFLGEHLRLMAEDVWEEPNVLKSAKKLCRLALRAQLGNRPLNSTAYLFPKHGAQPQEPRPQRADRMLE